MVNKMGDKSKSLLNNLIHISSCLLSELCLFLSMLICVSMTACNKDTFPSPFGVVSFLILRTQRVYREEPCAFPSPFGVMSFLMYEGAGDDYIVVKDDSFRLLSELCHFLSEMKKNKTFN